MHSEEGSGFDKNLSPHPKKHTLRKVQCLQLKLNFFSVLTQRLHFIINLIDLLSTGVSLMCMQNVMNGSTAQIGPLQTSLCPHSLLHSLIFSKNDKSHTDAVPYGVFSTKSALNTPPQSTGCSRPTTIITFYNISLHMKEALKGFILLL